MTRIANIRRFVILLAIPFLALLLGTKQLTTQKAVYAMLILTITCWVVALHHRSEMLRFRFFFIGIYSVLSTLGLLCAVLYFGAGRFLFLFIMFAALGCATLWIPGVLRIIIRTLGYFWKGKEAGVPEAMLLITSFLPVFIQDTKDSIKHSLANRPKITMLRNVFNGQFALAILISVLDSMNNLAAATISRRYRIYQYKASLSLSVSETAFYFAAGGGLTWLLLS